MEMPNVRNTLRDEARNVTFHVMAYRTLTPGEMLQSVRQWFAQRKGRRAAPKNQIITIFTLWGATPNV